MRYLCVLLSLAAFGAFAQPSVINEPFEQETRTLFMADHFGSPFAEGVPTANSNTASMARALEPLDLDINRIVTAHNARVFTGRDFEASVRAYRDYDCPDDRPLCSR